MVRLTAFASASSLAPSRVRIQPRSESAGESGEQDHERERERAGPSAMTRDGAAVFEHDEAPRLEVPHVATAPAVAHPVRGREERDAARETNELQVRPTRPTASATRRPDHRRAA